MDADEKRCCKTMFRLACLLGMVAVILSCATTHVTVSQISTERIQPAESITLLLNYRSGSLQDAEALEKSLGNCVANALKKQCPHVTFIQPSEFRKKVFPDKDITSTPSRIWPMLLISRSPDFQDAVKPLNLRYVVSVREHTRSDRKIDGVGGVGYGFAGYIGGICDDRTTELMARVIDIQRGTYSGRVQATAKASGFYGIFVFVPIIIPAFTESDACKSFGDAVAKFILGEEIGEQPERREGTQHPTLNGN
jgi:hypothetical protein